MTEDIRDSKGNLLARIIRSGFDKPGITFFTENELSQQVGYMNRPAGTIIQPHTHVPAPRNVEWTQEVLIIKKGKIRVDFYDQNRRLVGRKVLGPWDVVILISGGHGFQPLEDTQMWEVKNGPYVGEADKVRFDGHDVFFHAYDA